MQDLINHPAFQGGIAPFLTGLIITLAFRRAGAIQGLALLAGFLVTATLTVGLLFEPLTSTRKIILLVMAVTVLSLFVGKLKGTGKGEGLLLLLVLGGLTWVLWPYLARQELMQSLLIIGASALFALWSMIGMSMLRQRSGSSAGIAVTAMAFGLGGTATIGASALYGQLAMAIGAAAMGYVIVQIFTKSSAHAGWILVAIGGASVAIIAPSSVIYAKVPWFSLVALAFIPLLAQLEIAAKQPAVKRVSILFVVYMVPAVIAMGLTVQSAGPVPF